MIKTDKLIVGEDDSKTYAYLYHKIIGDGHCFINCYLDSCCRTYQKESNLSRKSHIARKMRIDFANYLMSESDQDPKFICQRLNILNPTTMASFFKLENTDDHVVPLFSEIEDTYKSSEEIDFDTLYALILSLDLRVRATGESVTMEFIKTAYERDPRMNIAIDESRSFPNATVDLDSTGIDRIPINIRFFELSNTVPTSADQIIESINILLSPYEFLTHEESYKIAKFLGINVIVFPMGNNYKDYLRLIDNVEGAPEILLVNLNNFHWNMISFKIGNNEQKLLIDVPEESKKQIFKNLQENYKRRML